MQEDKIIFANDEQRSDLLGKVNMLVQELESLREQIRRSPTAYEVDRTKIDAEWKDCWDNYPAITDSVDFAFCGSTWAISSLPFREAPRIVKEAVAKFGKELEQEKDEHNTLDSHDAFNEWLKNYPVETQDQ